MTDFDWHDICAIMFAYGISTTTHYQIFFSC